MMESPQAIDRAARRAIYYRYGEEGRFSAERGNSHAAEKGIYL
jgi:hypothetical protein